MGVYDGYMNLQRKIDKLVEENKELKDAIDYKRDLIYDMQVRNENYLDEIRTLKERIKKLQNVIERLGGENG